MREEEIFISRVSECSLCLTASILHLTKKKRLKVCVVCFQKAKNPITEIILQRIREFFIEDYDLDELCCPSAICSKCCSDLLDISNGNKTPEILPDVFDFGLIYPNVVSATRSTPHRICSCHICDTARTPVLVYLLRRERKGDHRHLPQPRQKNSPNPNALS